jgi:hypothetical protein
MDNRRIDITSIGKEDLALALKLFHKDKVAGYITRDNKLIFYWIKSDFAVNFPQDISLDIAVSIGHEWLTYKADYGEEPDHDGDNKKGWRMYNEAWGYIDNEWEAFVAIEPKWAMYGK